MIISKKHLGRRSFLRGSGAALALPLLDAMIPAMTAEASTAAAPVKRLGFIYIPMGANLKMWKPEQTGKITELSPTLKSLSPNLEQLSVLSNFELRNAYSVANHATANSAYLSAAVAKHTEGSDYHLATTVDQIAAKQIGNKTVLPSLELAMDLMTAVGNCDNGYACVYQNNLSWSNPTTPLPTEAHPRNVFERLFGNGASPEVRRRELRKDASILDWVRKDIKRLQKNLGPADRNKVDGYLTSIREVERRIQIAENRSGDAPKPDMDRPNNVPTSYTEHAKLMFDLQVLAMQGDLTRVMTFQLARETSNRSYPETGVSAAHHPTSHHGRNKKKLENLAKINAFHVSLFAYYVDKLSKTQDGAGTLLDHSMTLFGSGMGDPDMHDHLDLPILVAGGHKGGQHIRFNKPTPLANLHLTLLDKAGVKLDAFADSTGTLKELYPVSL